MLFKVKRLFGKIFNFRVFMGMEAQIKQVMEKGVNEDNDQMIF